MELNHLEYVAIPEYSSIFGHELNNEELIRLLSGIGCQKAIAILSRFSSLHIAICQQNYDAICLDWKLRMIHAGHIQDNGGNRSEYNRYKILTCPQSIFELEKWVLLYCSLEKDLSPILIPDLMLVMDALLAINDRLPKDEVEGNETEYLYLTLYHNSHKVIKHQIARAHYVFSTLAKQCPETVGFLKQYEDKKGFSIEERLSVLFNSLSNVIPQFNISDFFTKRLCVDAEEFDAKELSPVYQRVIRSIRMNYATAQKSVRKLLGQVWNFEPFYRNPFIKIENLQFAFSETTIVYQMWEGLYWDVRYTFHEYGEMFMTHFGRPFGQYVQQIMKASVSNSNGKASFQNEFQYKLGKDSHASTDCYFRIGNTLIAVEAKAKSPLASTLTSLDRTAIAGEVRELMVGPVRQATARLKEICSEGSNITGDIAGFFRDIQQSIVISVSMEKVQPIGELLFALDKEIGPELVGTSIVAYHNINIEEYEAICNLVELCPEELPDLLVNWFADQRKDIRSAVTLQGILSSYKKPYTCSSYVSQLFHESIQEICLKTFGAEMASRLNPL